AGAIRSSLALKPMIVNVHASGGPAMMRAAADAVAEAGAEGGADRPILLAVTVLTSMGPDDLAAVGMGDDPEAQVVRLARLAQQSGCDGVVCSPREIAAVRDACGTGFKLVVPGIRPEWAAKGDQKRVTTPKQALDAGADYLVIGRPITQADDPLDAARRIAAEMA
ncbi:MAG: orotidine-5'-phosphate decarboxylase, partial [Proteobacteria bacterium]|nr:orotidine-5'-phosphate decarboxylase [Pseudomonadota bacterium]